MNMHALIIGACLLISSFSMAGAQNKPNVIFIISDDQSYETIRAAGYTDIDTPNLDRLTASGTTFTHAYNMGGWAGAICVTSRTMLATGKTMWHAQDTVPKVKPNDKAEPKNTKDKANPKKTKDKAAPSETGDKSGSTETEVYSGPYWSQRMASQGYTTYMSGKWHVAVRPGEIFNHTVNIRPGMPKETGSAYNRPLVGKPDPWSPSDSSLGGFWEGGKHWSEVLGDDGVGFIESAAKSDKPFFMYLAFNAPHDPRQSPKEYVDRYPLDRIKVPESFIPEYPYKDGIGCDPKLRDEKLAPFPRNENAVKVHRQEYYAIITHMDAQVGRILDALDKSGKADNTWIIFTSDHGLACGHHGLMGKQNMYDHSIRVPFIVRGPGVKAGAKIDAPIYLQSATATALDIAGDDLKDIEFESLLPVLEGKSKGLDAVYGAYMNLQRVVIHDGWKLILYPEAKVARLYHLSEDPQEMKDLASDPALLNRKKTLFEKLKGLQEEMNDTLDLSPLFPELM